MEKKVLIFMTAVLVLMLAVFIFVPAPRPNSPRTNPDLKLYNLEVNQIVSSPLLILGEVKGSWYFEASFPVTLEDASGNILAQLPAEAKGDWMTTSSVPFEVKLDFKIPLTKTGFVIFSPDDPSGLGKNKDKTVKIPIIFENYTP
ncbi:MAG: hypothetical protein HY093_00370 [Candidatus Liptonbacteria bacterium]|nr:hypothetical protein [Candidatus Liptonbacteria bacterium]